MTCIDFNIFSSNLFPNSLIRLNFSVFLFIGLYKCNPPIINSIFNPTLFSMSCKILIIPVWEQPEIRIFLPLSFNIRCCSCLKLSKINLSLSLNNYQKHIY